MSVCWKFSYGGEREKGRVREAVTMTPPGSRTLRKGGGCMHVCVCWKFSYGRERGREGERERGREGERERGREERGREGERRRMHSCMCMCV